MTSSTKKPTPGVGQSAEPVQEFQDMLSLFRAAAAERGEHAALRYFDGVLSYRDLDKASDTLACWLLAQKVVRGDRVAIILQNMPQFVLMTVAAWKVGAVPVPGNPMYRQGELSRIFVDSEPAVLLCLDNHIDEVREALKDMSSQPKALLVTSPCSFQTRNDLRVIPPFRDSGAELSLEAVLAAGDHAVPPAIRIEGNDLGLILYTSGTTGVPKGAMIRHSSLAFQGEAMRDWCELHHQSRILAIAPFFHITGFSCHIATMLSARASMVLHYRVEPSLLLDVIREHRPTFTIGAITAFNALMGVDGITADDMSSFDRVYSGGAPIPPALRDQIQRRLGVTIHSSYGMTETTAHTHLAPFNAEIPVDSASGALSIGVPMPHVEARIVGEDGAELHPRDIGELAIRGPQVTVGYWRKPAETAAALHDGWLKTGDIAFTDENNWFYLVDRKKDVIIASGFKIWPREVEDVLYGHEAVREAAVIGVPDEYRGETVKAYVSLNPGKKVDPADLIDYCRTRLAGYKVPRSVDVLAELPKTVTGKIQRLALRDLPKDE